jgi:hypothetical protein
MDAQATFSCSFTQTDLGPVVELPSLPHWPAQRLLSERGLCPAGGGGGPLSVTR